MRAIVCGANGAMGKLICGILGQEVVGRVSTSTATATETVIPTMGLLPAPRKPIISTWAGTEEEPAN